MLPPTLLFAETYDFEYHIHFRQAKGSMQMSRGALLLELRIYLKKTIQNLLWPRLSAEKDENVEAVKKEIEETGWRTRTVFW